MEPAVAFQRLRRSVKRRAGAAVEDYRTDCAAQPIEQWLEITGPGAGIRLLREGSHDFHSLSELAKTIVRPGMSDLEKALAVYRFCTRNTYGAGVGWGNTEMTRFLNGHGYSYCWGHADLQHLLCEAVGLRARSPHLTGHSSVEVLIDGKWRMLDAFMQLVAPSPELDGLATGEELRRHPETWDHIRGDVRRADVFRSYWAGHAPGGTYEPWQDSRAMTLTLRRRESLRIMGGNLGAWCLAPGEPADYRNGYWRWRPILDADHLAGEAEVAENVASVRGGLQAASEDRPAALEYRLRSPYPLCRGTLDLRFGGRADVAVSLSTDCRRTWHRLHGGAAARLSLPLDAHLSLQGLPRKGGNSDSKPDDARHDVLLRVEWTGRAMLKGVDLRAIVQIHRPSVPSLHRGVNHWTLVGSGPGLSVAHAWEEYPDLRVSDPAPLEGREVTITARVHNRSGRPVRNVAVRFVQQGTDHVLGRTVVPRIKTRASAEASILWKAVAVPDRPVVGAAGKPGRYVNTVIRAEVGPEAEAGGWSGVARTVITVRPRPVPRFGEGLVWASDGRHAAQGRLLVRAALVNELGRDTDGRLNYLPDSPLSATLALHIGHPDKGGLPLGDPVRLEGIEPTEFAVAQWDLSTGGLPDRFALWVEAQCDPTVEADRRRLLARRNVVLRPPAL